MSESVYVVCEALNEETWVHAVYRDEALARTWLADPNMFVVTKEVEARPALVTERRHLHGTLDRDAQLTSFDKPRLSRTVSTEPTEPSISGHMSHAFGKIHMDVTGFNVTDEQVREHFSIMVYKAKQDRWSFDLTINDAPLHVLQAAELHLLAGYSSDSVMAWVHTRDESVLVRLVDLPVPV